MEWKNYSITQTVEVHRMGWIGLWDHFKSLVTGQERYSISKPITISFWSKGTFTVTLNQCEIGDDK